MSLFKAKEWWSTSCGSAEAFAPNSLCIANIDNSEDGQAKIVTGSLDGMLRVYSPAQHDFRIEHLLLEVELQAPILQLLAAPLSSLGGIQLAVLHPRQLVLYSMVSVGTSQAAAYLEVRKLWEHQLERSAACMVCGNFGRSRGVTHICVQSMDGQVAFFQQEALIFARFLPDFLLPGPLCYCPTLDAVITCNSASEVVCYKYQTLAAAQAAVDKVEGASPAVNQGKRLHADWSWTLGEAAHDIRSASYRQPDARDIIVLAEHAIVLLDDRGRLMWQRRLEYHPAALTMPQASAGTCNMLVAASQGQLLVYQGDCLAWAATAEGCPVALATAMLAGTAGLIVSLTSSGVLTVSYLGTEMSSSIVDMQQGLAVDFEAIEGEHRQLLSSIQSQAASRPAEPADQLVLDLQVPQALNPASSDGAEVPLMGSAQDAALQRRLTVRCRLRQQGACTAKDICLSAATPQGFQLEEDTFLVGAVSASDPQGTTILLTVHPTQGVVPPSNLLDVTASHMTDTGEPRIATRQVALPMSLYCQACAPQQAATFKLTVNTNKPPPPLSALFEDVLAQSPQIDPLQTAHLANVLSLQYHSGPVVTILVSKSAGRYRIQSEHFHAMHLPLQELCQRLQRYFANLRETEPLVMVFEDALPLHELFVAVDKHLAARQAAAGSLVMLGQRATQYRAVQKRLLVRFKDRNPAPMAHLDTLLEDTYSQLLEVGKTLEEQTAALSLAAAHLSCVCHLVQQLCRLSFAVTESHQQILNIALPTQEAAASGMPAPVQVQGRGDVGWEEGVTAACCHTLQTTLARSAAESAVQPKPLTCPDSSAELKQLLGIVLERLAQHQP